MKTLSALKHRLRRGFTRTEMVIVLLLVALLVSIGSSVPRGARERAKEILCLARLRDLGHATQQYIDDNNGELMTSYEGTVSPSGRAGGRWFFKLIPYYNLRWVSTGVPGSPYDFSGFFCPKHPRIQRDIGLIGNGGKYGYNFFFIGHSNPYLPGYNPSYGWGRVEQVKVPGELPLFTEMSDEIQPGWSSAQPYMSPVMTVPHASAFAYGWNNGVFDPALQNGSGAAPNHCGNINHLFADFHAASDGLWPYEATKHDPQDGDYYRKFWHPKGDLSINPHWFSDTSPY